MLERTRGDRASPSLAAELGLGVVGVKVEAAVGVGKAVCRGLRKWRWRRVGKDLDWPGWCLGRRATQGRARFEAWCKTRAEFGGTTRLSDSQWVRLYQDIPSAIEKRGGMVEDEPGATARCSRSSSSSADCIPPI